MKGVWERLLAISSRPYGTLRLSNFYPGLRPGLSSARADQISGLVEPVGLILLDELVGRPIMWKSGWGSRAAEFETFSRCFGVWVRIEAKRCRTYGARDHPPSMPQPYRAGLTFGGPALRA